MSFVQKSYDSNFNLENFFKEIKLKKQCVQKLKNKVTLLNTLKERDYKKINSSLFLSDSNQKLVKEDFLITYIINITYSKTNTLLHVMDFSGNLKFFCSAGSLQYKGKGKKLRSLVIKDMYKILMLKLKFLKDQPVALHLKNVGFAKFWIIKLLKKKFFIKVVRSFNSHPYNGCRKRKMRRKKF